MRVIALDPGALTGWAAADIDDVGEWSNAEHGILPAKDMVEQLAVDQGLGLMDGTWAPTKFAVIVYEAWVLYRGHVEEYIGSEMPYNEQIGQYRLIAWMSNTKIVKQPAARKTLALKQARAFRPALAAKIEDMLQRSHKDSHDADALLHLWGFTVDRFPVARHAN